MLAEQRQRKDEAESLVEEKRKEEEKRLAEIEAKRRDFEANLKDKGVKSANEAMGKSADGGESAAEDSTAHGRRWEWQNTETCEAASNESLR